jgi:DNA-binding transcriptional ArsR family regulator
MRDLDVIDQPAQAAALLDPLRAQLLAELVEPSSASSLAAKIGLPRQKVNYHLRELERHGLVALVGERRKRNMTERLLQASAQAYVISPDASPELAPDPAAGADALSGRWLIALAARIVSEVGSMLGEASGSGKRVGTFALDGEVRFASAADRAAFAEELTSAVTGLVSKYHDESAKGGRRHRLLVALHPGGSAAGGRAQTADRG